MAHPLPLLSLLLLLISTVLSQQSSDYDSRETAFNKTSINKEEDSVSVYLYQPSKEWFRLKAILALSAGAGCLAFVGLCCVCGLKAGCEPQDISKRKYLSHA